VVLAGTVAFRGGVAIGSTFHLDSVPHRITMAAALIGLVCCLSNFAAVLIFCVGGPLEPAFERYLLATVFLPFLLLSLLVRLLPWRQVRRAGLVLPFVAALGAILYLGQSVPSFSMQHLRQPYPVMAQVLDDLAIEGGYRYGLADFWTARA